MEDSWSSTLLMVFTNCSQIVRIVSVLGRRCSEDCAKFRLSMRGEVRCEELLT